MPWRRHRARARIRLKQVTSLYAACKQIELEGRKLHRALEEEKKKKKH